MKVHGRGATARPYLAPTAGQRIDQPRVDQDRTGATEVADWRDAARGVPEVAPARVTSRDARLAASDAGMGGDGSEIQAIGCAQHCDVRRTSGFNRPA